MDAGPATLKSRLRKHRRHLGLVVGIGLLVVALTVSAVSIALAANTGFSDVPSSHPYSTAIADLASRGIINGYGDGRFGPNETVTRQQFAKMIVLTGGYSVSEADVCPFLDVTKGGPGDLFPDNYIAVAAAHGITTGVTATTFNPAGKITRYQVVSMVVRATDDLHAGLLAAPAAGWGATWGPNATHGANAARAQYNGLLDGLPLAAMDPNGYMTRGEVAQVLHNLLTLLTHQTTTTTSATTTTTTMVTTTTTSSTTTSSTTSSSTTSSTTTPTTVLTPGYEDLGGAITSSPAVASWGTNRLDVFARGAAGQLLYRTYNGLEWSRWGDLGGLLPADSGIAALATAAHPVDVFARSIDNTLLWRYNDGNAWSPWLDLGGKLTSGPAAVDLRNGSMAVFARSATGTLVMTQYTGASWLGWTDLGGALKSGSEPAAFFWSNGRIDVFVRGSDNGLWQKTWSGVSWGSWIDQGGALTSGPALASWLPGRLDVFVRGTGNTIWRKAYANEAWSTWQNLGGGTVASAPAAVSWGPDRIDVFARSSSNTLLWKYWDGDSWQP